MYGKRRVVLETTGRIAICGSNEPSVIQPGRNCGSYHRIGFWYKDGDRYYADLRSEAQFYHGVAREDFAHIRQGCVPTKKDLREYVMTYYKGECEPRGLTAVWVNPNLNK